MQRSMKYAALTGAVLCVLTTGAFAQNTFTGAVTGVYDENVFAANTVDTIADATATGTDDAASATDTLDLFKAAIPTAFTGGFGGVMNFDNNTTNDLPALSAINATYAGGTKTLGITLRDFANTTTLTGARLVEFGTATSLSGAGAATGNRKILEVTAANNDYRMNFGTISGELLSQVGITLANRNGGTDNSTSTLTAYFSGGGTASLSSQLRNINIGTDDTFFSFTAPTGQSITALGFNLPNDRYVPADDLGFITTASAVAVPEAGTLSLFAPVLGVFAVFAKRRHS